MERWKCLAQSQEIVVPIMLLMGSVKIAEL